MKSLTKLEKYSTDFDFKTKVLSKISRAIEEMFGKQEPSAYSKKAFEDLEEEIKTEIFRSSNYNEEIFLQHEKNLLNEIKNEDFLPIDFEKPKEKSKRKNLTKHERNDRKREKETKIRFTRRLNDVSLAP